jgi:hypothetical protein
LSKVCKEVEAKTGIPRGRVALVYQSHYLKEEGMWNCPIEWVEFRVRGIEGLSGVGW